MKRKKVLWQQCDSCFTASHFYFISLLIVTIDWVFSLPGSLLRWAQQGKRLIGFASEKLLITTGAENIAEGSNQGDQPGLTITETEFRDDKRKWQHNGKTLLGNEADASVGGGCVQINTRELKLYCQILRLRVMVKSMCVCACKSKLCSCFQVKFLSNSGFACQIFTSKTKRSMHNHEVSELFIHA